jgi:hypothetical protein
MNSDDLFTWKLMAKNPSYWEVADKNRIAAIVVEEATEANRLSAMIQAVHDYAAYYHDVSNRGDAPETFVNWYNGANQAGNPYVTQQEVSA